MIARPHICLRCQLRLSRRPYSAATPVLRESNYTRVIPELRGEETKKHSGVRRPLKNVKFVKLGHNLLPRPIGNVSEHPLGRLYGYLGQMQRENRESLENMSTLGDPAEVIILRDSKINTFMGSLREIDAIEPESIDILATLDNERGLVGQKEVEENINLLRPKEGEYPQNWEELDSLVQELQSGFTVSQLARYVQSYEAAKGPMEASPEAKSGALIPRISPWIPDASNPTRTSDGDFTRGYAFESYTSKQRLALRLIRECWKLDIPEPEDGIGEVELELRPGDYELLLGDTSQQSILSAISSEYITSEQESIEGFRSHNTIRVTTTREKSDLIIQEIEQELNNVRKIEIPLADLVPSPPMHNHWQRKQWIDANFDNQVLNHLGGLTRTNIKRINSQTLLISCIDHHADSLVSNRADTALRLLLTSAEMKDRTTHWLGFGDTTNTQKGTFIKYPTSESFSWREGLRDWFRWTTPIRKDSTKSIKTPMRLSLPLQTEDVKHQSVGAEIKSEAIKSKTQPKATNSVSPPSILSTTDRGAYHWSKKYFINSSALLGTILHNLPSDSKTWPNKPLPTNLSEKAMHAFATTVPNISRLISSKDVDAIRPQAVESLIMRFMPNPFYLPSNVSRPIGSKALTAFPQVEMCFSVDSETDALSLRNVQAVLSTKNSDLMLSDSSVDVRFQQIITSKLRGQGGEDAYPGGIMEFIKNSNLNIRGSRGVSKGKLETPPKLMIPIDSHLTEDPGFELLGQQRTSIVHDVEYLFAGLEIHKTMVMGFDDWELEYTSIEAGRANGRRGELRLRPNMRGKRREATGQLDNEEEFVKSAFKLVDALDGGRAPVSKHDPADRQIMKRAVNSQQSPVVNGREKKTHRNPTYFAHRIDFGSNEGVRKDEKNDDLREKPADVEKEDSQPDLDEKACED